MLTDTNSKRQNIHFGDSLDVYISQSHKIRFRHPRIERPNIRFRRPIILISPNYNYTFRTKSKMDPFECQNFEEDTDHEMGFTRSHPKGYYELIDNLHRVGNLIYKYKQELKMGQRNIAQIAESPQGGESFTGVFDDQ